MAGYDPKAKRAHSRAAPDGPAPVDDLLGVPATSPRGTADSTPAATDRRAPAPPAPRRADRRAAGATPRPETRPLAPTPAAATGPDPKVLAAVGAAVLAALLFWRHRHRGSD